MFLSVLVEETRKARENASALYDEANA